ncbi:MAG: hypothetical protein IH597_06025 [Bacteroidales bacterium]|nr:hypothetical protein [Bacteroidales bacterium]
MKRIRPAKIRSLRELQLEKERFRYLALRTELELSQQLRFTRRLFTLPNLVMYGQSFLTRYLKRLLMRIFGK